MSIYDPTNHSFSLYQSVTRGNGFTSTCTSSLSPDVSWRFCQAFGDDNSPDDDLITAVEFDPSGNYVTVGDKAGRLCLFEAQSNGVTHRGYVSSYLDQMNEKQSLPYPRRRRVGVDFEQNVNSPAYAEWVDNNQLQDFHVPGFEDVNFDPITATPYAKFIKERCKNGLVTKTIGEGPPPASSSDITFDNIPHSSLPQQQEYRFFTEFQSHESEFDCLKSNEIPSTIHSVKWVDSTPTSQSIIAANDKTIKFWSLRDKALAQEVPSQQGQGANGGNGSGGQAQGGGVTGAHNSAGTHGSFIIPQRVTYQTLTLALRRGVYQNAHLYHINSLSTNPNGQNFLSCDDVRILNWDYEYPMQPFNLVDVRPPQIEEITEVITTTSMHPSSSSLFLYATSRGGIKMCDMRMNALCEQTVHVSNFDIEEDPVSKTFFSEILSSISDAKFTKSGQYIVSRDFLNVYIWDTRNDVRPVAVFNVHDYLKQHFSELYEFDALFDNFKLDCSPDGLQVLTGSYHNNFHIHNWHTGQTLNFEAGQRLARKRTGYAKRKVLLPSGHSVPTTLPPQSYPGSPQQQQQQQQQGQQQQQQQGQQQQGQGRDDNNNDELLSGQAGQDRANENVNISLINFHRKALHCAWHPSLDCVAVAGVNKLYIYQAFAQQQEANGF